MNYIIIYILLNDVASIKILNTNIRLDFNNRIIFNLFT